MEQLLLTKCDNPILADEICSLLEENGIASRQHDEWNDTVVGAYGGTTGIAIYIYNKDAAHARALVADIMSARERGRKTLARRVGEGESNPRTTRRPLIGLALVLLSGIYLGVMMRDDQPTDTTIYMAMAVFLVGLLALLIYPSKEEE